MTITFGTPNGPLVLGPGAPVSAFSDLLGLSNPPYHWHFSYTGPDDTFHFTQDVVTDHPLTNAGHILLWSTPEIPSDLLSTIHAKFQDTIKVDVTVRDDEGLILDQMVTQNVQWDPIAWMNTNLRLYQNSLVRLLEGSAGSSQLDRIEAAVYRRFPNP